MAIVKKTQGANAGALSRKPAGTMSTQRGSTLRDQEQSRKRARTIAKQQQVAERIAAATSQIASGVNEAASAAEELKRASDQIAMGAEEAASAAQESLVACGQITQSIARQLSATQSSQARMEATQARVLTTGDDISQLISNVSIAAQRQAGSVELINQLEKQAANIGDIVKAVARIADQTNLLALNAAIEAARAGRHGKGFAVVADEVRTLAETSEASARQITDLVANIQTAVQDITTNINQQAKTVQEEVEKGHVINTALDAIRADMALVMDGVAEIAAGAVQSNAAATQALKGAEEIATAAAQQSAAAEESAKSVEEQAQALAESEQMAMALSEISEDLKNSTDIAKSAEDVASATEELSAAVQSINRAATQIMSALEEIRKGTETSAAATTQSASAMAQIERGIHVAQQRASQSVERISSMRGLLAQNKVNVSELITGISQSAERTRVSIRQIRDLALLSQRINKIVDAIATVSVQTNMLAVNGSIEAARAGEYGKGFAVVATDIRNLARDSAENADRIKDLVKNIQDQIEAVGQDMDEIVKAAIAEAQKAEATTANLLAIESDIITVQESSEAIMASAEEIAVAITQAKKGVDQIAAASQQAERSAVEAATAARQQTESADMLLAAVDEIASMADELQTAV